MRFFFVSVLFATPAWAEAVNGCSASGDSGLFYVASVGTLVALRAYFSK